MSSVLVTRDGGIMRITLNRPEKLNAFDAEMAQATREAFGKAAAATIACASCC